MFFKNKSLPMKFHMIIEKHNMNILEAEFLVNEWKMWLTGPKCSFLQNGSLVFLKDNQVCKA